MEALTASFFACLPGNSLPCIRDNPPHQDCCFWPAEPWCPDSPPAHPRRSCRRCCRGRAGTGPGRWPGWGCRSRPWQRRPAAPLPGEQARNGSTVRTWQHMEHSSPPEPLCWAQQPPGSGGEQGRSCCSFNVLKIYIIVFIKTTREIKFFSTWELSIALM